ncbi:MAG TPA: hypothetical protein DDW85_09565 [Porphyromonadaceae bacterium]|nr:hypothetical protein [Porphyromonadaceae bacterium]
MKKVRAFMFSLHRITGTIISLFFFMWFISGLVLIYYPFPNVSPSQKYENMDALPDSLPDINSILVRLPESGKTIKKLSVRYFRGQTLFTVKTNDRAYTICSDTLKAVNPLTWESIEHTAKKWVDAPIIKIDTLTERDQWIMYSRYKAEMPIYKFYFNDKQKHQLYISSRTGEVQQFTDKGQRFRAFMGAIPHKFYIPAIRKNTKTWTTLLTIGGVIALIAALSGIYLGVYITYRKYKAKRRIGSPYKNYWYKWHHILGLIFGIFLATFAFSGAMALQRIPSWVIKTHGDYRVSSSQLRGKYLSADSYKLDYRILAKKYPDIKSIEWEHFQEVPIYNIVVGNKEIRIDASSSDVKELYLQPSVVEKAVQSIHKTSELMSTTLINEYDEYYLSKERSLPLPIYKIKVENADNSIYYINPKTGDFKYFNQSRKAKKWIFSGLHYLNIKWLVERPVLWTIAIWLLCLGGACVSFSGIWLGIKYMRRKIKSFF